MGFDVYCVCYSRYLSDRDFNDSKSLFETFGINGQIKYGTFGSITEEIINEQGELRSSVRQLVETGKHPTAKLFTNRQKVLIIDEVDVFFDMTFYGKIYQPMFVLKSEAISELIKSIWSMKNQPVIDLTALFNQDSFKKVQQEYPKFIDLIKEAVKEMVFDVKQIDAYTNYVVKDDKI